MQEGQWVVCGGRYVVSEVRSEWRGFCFIWGSLPVKWDGLCSCERKRGMFCDAGGQTSLDFRRVTVNIVWKLISNHRSVPMIRMRYVGLG